MCLLNIFNYTECREICFFLSFPFSLLSLCVVNDLITPIFLILKAYLKAYILYIKYSHLTLLCIFYILT